jgi:hypothetical protein
MRGGGERFVQSRDVRVVSCCLQLRERTDRFGEVVVPHLSCRLGSHIFSYHCIKLSETGASHGRNNAAGVDAAMLHPKSSETYRSKGDIRGECAPLSSGHMQTSRSTPHGTDDYRLVAIVVCRSVEGKPLDWNHSSVTSCWLRL